MPVPLHDFESVHGLSLDIWGTILRSNPAFKPVRNRMLQTALGVPLSPDFDARLRAACKESDAISIHDGRDQDMFDTLLRVEGLDGFNEEVMFNEDEQARVLNYQATCAREHPPFALHRGLPDLVREIAQHIPVAVTSNTGLIPGSLMRELLSYVGFDDFVAYSFSDEIEGKGAKPFPAIFEHTVVGLDVPAGGILHVGDNYVADVLGAHGVGMQVGRVEGYSETDTFNLLTRLLRFLR